MLILTDIPEHLIRDKYSDEDRERIAATLYDMLDTAYVATTSPDCYIAELSGSAVEGTGLVLGADNMTAILSRAENWNLDIDAEFEKIMGKITAQPLEPYTQDPRLTKKWHTSEFEYRYGLMKATMAMNDTLYMFADKAVHQCDWGQLTPLLPDDILEDIKLHPENYALLDIFPK